jgi:hypothetical protein
MAAEPLPLTMTRPIPLKVTVSVGTPGRGQTPFTTTTVLDELSSRVPC